MTEMNVDKCRQAAAVRSPAMALLAATLSLPFLMSSGNAKTERTEIVIEGPDVFPESITSLRDGTIITGSVGSGGLFKAAPGATNATQWIVPGDNGLLDVFGVLADETTGTLWVCSSRMDAPASGTAAETPALYQYNLESGAYRTSHPLPGSTGLCNDIAIGPDSAAYVADTSGGRILRLPVDGEVLEEWSTAEELAGADGLAFLGRDLFVNSFTSGLLFRISMNADGSAGEPVTIATSRPLVQPDGMRPLNATQLVQASQGTGTIDLLTVRGDAIEIETLRSGLTGPAAVTINGEIIWALESKLGLRGNAEVEPAPFKVYAVPLPTD